MLGYIDPGAGGLLMQVLLGGVAGIAVFLTMRWQRVRSLFGLAEAEADAETTSE